MDKIGGDFSVDISQYAGYSAYDLGSAGLDQVFLSGRSALSYILSLIGYESSCLKKIHLPYYICESVTNTIHYHGFPSAHYNLNEAYTLNLDYLSDVKEGEILFLVNYFGFTPQKNLINKIKTDRPDIIVINDDVHSYWTYDTTAADYSFTSLRKHFPVIGGGLAKVKSPIEHVPRALKINTSFAPLKLLGSTLKALQIQDLDYLKFLNEAEHILDCNYDADLAPDIVPFLFSQLNFAEIKAKRMENYKTACDLANRVGLPLMFEYNEEIIPMNVPMLVLNKREVIFGLRSSGVFLPSYWPLGTNQEYSEQSKKLSDTQISILIDHRYTSEDIERQVELLKKYID